MTDVRDDPIEGARLRPGMTVDALVGEYARCGINARSIAETTDIVEAMVADDDCAVIMSIAGPMVPGGLRGVFSAVVEAGWVDAIVTTGATLTHDTIEALGGAHHHGEAPTHDGTDARREHDERLREASIDRIYNVYLPQEHFATFEAHLWERVFPELTGEPCTIAALTRALGVANHEVAEGDVGLTATAARSDVPIFCPAMQDSILGLQAWLYSRTHDFAIDALGDMTDLTELASSRERAGAILVAGGVPKNFALQTKLVTPGAYDYAVQFTMDPEETGGLTGASLDEARSWGKLDPDAENATVLGDATVTVPLVFAAVFERLA
ncbi:MAG: deoxyhypusine synthase [Halobacteriota archaeon]